MSAPFELKPLAPHFGAEAVGADVTDLSDDAFKALRAAVCDAGVLLVRGQDIDAAAQVAFSDRFGPVEPVAERARAYSLVEPGGYYNILSNLDPETDRPMAPDDRRIRALDGNALWHTDRSFNQVASAFTLLYACEVPPVGGETQYADMRLAWEELPAELKSQLDGKVAEHSLSTGRKRSNDDGFFTSSEQEKIPLVTHPVVLTHPETGRRALYLGAHCHRIIGMDESESRRLIDDLMARATRPENVYSHPWRSGDLLIWDNRTVLHRATPYMEGIHRRVMRNTGVQDVTRAA